VRYPALAEADDLCMDLGLSVEQRKPAGLSRRIWAPSWKWVIAANALLGINQGLAWSMTVIMKIDLVGPKSRGLAVGLNEFAGYLAVGVTAYLTGYLASEYGLRPALIYLGVAYAMLGAALSSLLVRDTREHVRLETAGWQPAKPEPEPQAAESGLDRKEDWSLYVERLG
jgi:MFS family permease